MWSIYERAQALSHSWRSVRQMWHVGRIGPVSARLQTARSRTAMTDMTVGKGGSAGLPEPRIHVGYTALPNLPHSRPPVVVERTEACCRVIAVPAGRSSAGVSRQVNHHFRSRWMVVPSWSASPPSPHPPAASPLTTRLQCRLDAAGPRQWCSTFRFGGIWYIMCGCSPIICWCGCGAGAIICCISPGWLPCGA